MQDGRWRVRPLTAGDHERWRSLYADYAASYRVEQTDEPFINPCGSSGPPCELPKEITIPPDHYFMMGDNRGASDDSRFWGPVPRDWIIGEAFATYWPPNRIGGL